MLTVVSPPSHPPHPHLQDLARTIASEEDVPLPEEDEQGDGAFALSSMDMDEPSNDNDPDAPPRLAVARASGGDDAGKGGGGDDDDAGTVFGIKRSSLLNRGRSTLGLMSLGQVMMPLPPFTRLCLPV